MLRLNSRARYGLLALVALAEDGGDEFVGAQELARRRSIPPKYLGQILALLVQAGVVAGRRGSGGGYKLAVSPFAITLDRVLLALGASDISPRCIYGVDRGTCTLPYRQAKCDGIGPAEEAAMAVLASTTLADMCPGYAKDEPSYQI